MTAVLGFIALVGTVAHANGPTTAPVNPGYIAYLDAVAAGTRETETEDGHGLGSIPAPHDPTPLAEKPWVEAPRALPASYDLRAIVGKLPPVHDQGPCGSCWTFATYGSLESCLRLTDVIDGSEQNLKNTHGFDYGHCAGGHSYMSAAYLSRWSGSVYEPLDPYNPLLPLSPPGLPPERHVQQVYWLPLRLNSTDNDGIKYAVLHWGGVYVSYHHDNTYYNPSNGAYYYPSGAVANHAVTIVGWDDAYPSGNFAVTPQANGAFLCRNSWGTGWGIGGYFWVSYYDGKLGYDSLAVFNNGQPVANYDTCYAYDPLGWVTSLGLGGTTMHAANMFTKSSAIQRLEAVGLYTTAPNDTCTLHIYRNCPAGNPTGGTLVATQGGVLPYMGYYTVPLTAPVTLGPTDTDFAVVAKLTTTGYTFPQAIEYVVPLYSSAAVASAGQSYYSADGATWFDLTSWNSTANFCLKAYGNDLTPTLEWAGLTGYTSDGVDPDTGDLLSTTFTFRVKYTDPGGGAPLRARCIIHRKECRASWSSQKQVTLTREYGNVATGAIYSGSVQLPNKVLRHRFWFRSAAWYDLPGAPTSWKSGPQVEGPPTLCWTGTSGFGSDGVDPDSGTTGTNFRFQVLYSDSAGDPATTRQLVIRRNGHIWRQKTVSPATGGDYRLGKIYRTTVPISMTGTYEYRFNIADADGQALGPPNNWTSGPTITGTTSVLTALAANPTVAGAEVTFCLSAGAQLTATVVNVAGRPVRTLVADRPCEAGMGTLTWDRKAASGLSVPAGLYLIRVTAKDAAGAQSTALATLVLR